MLVGEPKLFGDPQGAKRARAGDAVNPQAHRSMIPKSGCRFSEQIMLKQKAKAKK
jgi:hypothetical protein